VDFAKDREGKYPRMGNEQDYNLGDREILGSPVKSVPGRSALKMADGVFYWMLPAQYVSGFCLRFNPLPDSWSQNQMTGFLGTQIGIQQSGIIAVNYVRRMPTEVPEGSFYIQFRYREDIDYILDNLNGLDLAKWAWQQNLVDQGNVPMCNRKLWISYCDREFCLEGSRYTDIARAMNGATVDGGFRISRESDPEVLMPDIPACANPWMTANPPQETDYIWIKHRNNWRHYVQ